DADCDHFELTTQDAGPVRVVATWPGPSCDAVLAATGGTGACTPPDQNFFDLLVCVNDPLADLSELVPDECAGGTTIHYCPSQNIPGFNECDFVAIANQQYEIRVLPIFITTPGSDYHGCAEYTTVSTQACAAPPVITPPPVSASEFFSCNDTKQRQMDGGGNIPAVSDPTK